MKAGVIKQKWTAEEEAALRAGVEKYGPGKWRAIQKDDKFGPCLVSRSNVDLKDKWRNMSVSANGLGSRDKAARMLASKMKQVSVAHLSSEAQVASVGNIVRDKKLLGLRFDNMVLEAVTALKEPNGCNRDQIASYLEDHYSLSSNLRRLLVPKLKFLTQQGKLIKIRRNYIINAGNNFLREEKVDKLRYRRPDVEVKHHSSMDSPLQESEDSLEGNTMTAADAAKLAAQAVAEAEAAAAAAREAAAAAIVAEAEWEAAEEAAEAAAALAIESPRHSVNAMLACHNGLPVLG